MASLRSVLLWGALAALPLGTAQAGLPLCYASTDTSSTLVSVVPSPGASPLPTATQIPMTSAGSPITFLGEGAAYRAVDRMIYIYQQPSDDNGPADLWRVNPTTGVATLVVDDHLTSPLCSPSADCGVDGVEFAFNPADPNSEVMYVVARDPDNSDGYDLYAFDPDDTSVHANGFSPIAGYPKTFNSGISLSSLAFNVSTQTIYGAKNGAVDLYTVNPATGALTLLLDDCCNALDSGKIDGEGLSVAADGNLYIEDEASAALTGIYKINLPASTITQAAVLPNSLGDYESIMCNSGERSDLGDAPISYGQVLHLMPVYTTLTSSTYLGDVAPDDDSSLAQFSNGTGDDAAGDDEDGVSSFPALVSTASSYSVTVDCTGSGTIKAWIDFDRNGVFNTDEASTPVACSGNSANVNWPTVPGDITLGSTYARFRIASSGAEIANPTGRASSGEVEDYPIQIVATTVVMKIDKDTATASVKAGGLARYTIRVLNTGTAVATGVTVSDSLPAGFTYVSSIVTTSSATRTATTNPSAGSSSPSWGTWNISPGGSVTITLTVKVAVGTTPATYDNTAVASASNHPTIDDQGTVGQDADTPAGQDPEADEDITVSAFACPAGQILNFASVSAIQFDSNVTNNVDAICTIVNPAPISGRVVNDIDGDGDLAERFSEAGIVGVTVQLWTDPNGDGNPADGVLYDSTVTDANGAYIFNDVPAGKYVVVETNPGGYTSTNDIFGPNDDWIPVTRSGTTASTANDFLDALAGNVNLGSIGDRIFNDSGSDNGQFDAGEGIAGVTVWVDFNGNGLVDVNEPFAITDAQGLYTIADLPVGSFSVKVLTSTLPGGLPPHTIDPDGVLDDQTLVTLGSGEHNTTTDFGYGGTFSGPPPSTIEYAIGDRVWIDTDGDGIQDIGEPGKANVEVILRRDDDGTPGPSPGDSVIGTQITDANGNYLFTGEGGGDYYVEVNDTTLPPNLKTAPGTTDPSAVITITGSGEFLDLDFGYVSTDSTKVILGDRIWSDANNDGVQDPGEVGIEGVVLNLLNADGTPTGITTTTGPSGQYLFTDIDPGSYKVEVAASNFTAGQPLEDYTVTIGPQSEGAEISSARTLAAGDIVSDLDFGYVNAAATYTIANTVWFDISGDGVYQPDGIDGNPATTADNEFGLGGVTVNLLDAGGNVVATTITSDGTMDIDGDGFADPAGEFAFTGVPNGDYTIEIADNTNELAGLSGTSPPAYTYELDVTVSSADVDERGDPNFGYNVPGGIGDTVYSDTNGNGVQDPGELGIAGVTVELYRDSNGNGTFEPGTDTLVKTQFTDGAGNYLFDELTSGTYFVKIPTGQAVLGGYTQTGDPDQPGAACTACDDEGTVVLVSSAATYLAADFGYQNNSLPDIYGNVWNDLNENAVIEGGEPRLAGVTIALVSPGIVNGYIDINGDGLITAADDGNYGGYAVENGVIDAVDDTIIYGMTVKSGGLDVNGDGIANSADDRDPAVVSTTTTSDGTIDVDGDGFPDPIGEYAFTDVPEGTYTVMVTDDAEVLKGYLLTSGLDEIDVTVAAADVNNIDFGYARKQDTGSIGDRVWLDSNGDGVQGASEAGISGITVELFDEDDVSLGTTITDANGNYLFDGLPAGNYYVDVISGVPGSLDLTAGSTDPTGLINLSEGESYLDADIGYKPTAGTVVLGDRVWYDTDGDGLQDAGEAGIGGVDVVIYDPTTDTSIIVTTNPDGSWLATGLDAGKSYAVFVDTGTLPEGVIAKPTNLDEGDTYVTPVLSAGSVLTSLDFGFNGGVSGAIGDTIWLDTDGDGIRDAGEEGLSGVGVRLWSLGPDGIAGTDDDFRAGSTTTDANGEYLFTGLQDGKYYVQIATLPYAGGLDPTPDTSTTGAGANATNGQTGVITLADGEFYAAADFGYVPNSGTALIGNRIWSDADGNGVQDEGEAGIGGVTVELQPSGGGAAIATATTAEDGSYLFTNVPPGSYEVVVTDSNNVLTTYTQTGDPDGGCSPCNTPDETSVTVADGDVNLGADFGYQDLTNANGSIGDTIYADSNGNGAQDGSEAGIDGVTVNLLTIGIINGYVDLNGDGVISSADDGSYGGFDVYSGAIDTSGNGTIGSEDTGTVNGFAVIDGRLDVDGVNGVDGNDDQAAQLLASTTTAGGGNYTFSGLPAGDYRVDVTDTGNLLNGLTETQSPSQDLTIVCSSGCNAIDTADFGYAPTTTVGTIGDEVFLDANGNGTWDDGEGLSGVTVNLYDPGPDGVVGGGDDTLIATTTSDGDGKYTFAGLPAGNYYVDLDQTTLPDGGADLTQTVGSDPTAVIPLSTGELYDSADFGYVPDSNTAVIGDRVWSDANGDGIQDDGETGIGGVTVELQFTGCTPGSDCPTAVTAADGSYQFTNVPATGTEDYTVVVLTSTLPAGYAATPTNNGGSASYALTDLSSGEVVNSVDWGFTDNGSNTNVSSIGNTVYRDSNGNGTQDGSEGGIAGVTISLYDSNGNLVASTTTDSNGNYSFSGLPAGDYEVVITDTAGVLNGLYATQSDGNVTLGANETYTDANFGMAQGTASGSIGDSVYFDADGDGFQDAGEAGISGVTLNLYEAGPDGVLGTSDDVLVDTTTSDQSGNYLFDGLAEGKYQVVVTDQNNVVGDLIATEVAGSPILVSCATTCTTVSGADFGYKPTVGDVGNIGGTIWRDTINPGVAELEAGEPGIAGVEVELWLDVNGDGIITAGVDNLVRTTITDANGDYNFLGLPPGDYIVRVPNDTVPNVDGNTGAAANPVLTGMQSITHSTSPDADSNGHSNSYPVTLTSGVTDTSVDFAYEANDPYNLSGKVYEDAKGDGGAFNPPEDALAPGATVTLHRVVNGVEYFVDSTTTNSNGDYSFVGLPPGDYVVRVDTSGTAVEGLRQTVDWDETGPICSICDGKAEVTITTADKSGVDFAYWNGGVVTTPVTLSYFEALAGDERGEVNFWWSTVTELGNIGFDIYAVTPNGAWQQVNDELIPTQEGMPVEIRHYYFNAVGVQGDTFYIVDTDEFGSEIEHGPFRLGEVAGAKPLQQPRPDWNAIKAEHEVKKSNRKEFNKRKMKEKLEKTKQRLEAEGNPQTSTQPPQAHWATRLAGALLSLMVSDAYAAEVPYPDNGLMQIKVTQPGIQRLSYEDILAAGLDLHNVKTREIAVTSKDGRVPVWVGRDDGVNSKSFGPGWYIEFLGRPLLTLYSRTNNYRLHVDRSLAESVHKNNSSPKSRDPAEPYYLESKQVAEENGYSAGSPVSDPWYMVAFQAKTEYERDLEFTIDEYYNGAQEPAHIEIVMWGVTDYPEPGNDHHVFVSLNEDELAEESFDGKVERIVSVDLPDGTLQEGVNNLHFYLPMDTGKKVDYVNLDRFTVTYPRNFVAKDNKTLHFGGQGKKFEINGLASDQVVVYRQCPGDNVELMSGSRVMDESDGSFSVAINGNESTVCEYYVSTVGALHAPELAPPLEDEDITSNPAQYLVIAHPDFIGVDATGNDPLTELALERGANGLSVQITDVEQIYAQFNHDNVDAQAIRDYIAYAQANMGTEMVLLVGGDTLDYLGNKGPGAVSFIPSLYAQTGPLVYFAPVDPLYADVDFDNIPDLAIGRFPVRNSRELREIVKKTQAWEFRKDYSDNYAYAALFAADDYDVSLDYDFKADSEDMLARLPEQWRDNVTRAYVDDDGIDAARTTLIDTLNEGAALTSFVGHSGPGKWTFDNLFVSTDAIALQNNLRPTIVTQWGCWNTYYVEPLENTMAHEFLLNGEQGAVAVLGASTLTEAIHERELAKQLYDRLFQAGMTLGEAVLQAKKAYAASAPSHADVILGWVLLGDPGLVIED